MTLKRFIPLSHSEGVASRQAHADVPEGTFEREISKEGFNGPAAFFHHRHPPTAWTSFEGPLRPHAYDLSRLNESVSSPWNAAEILGNDHMRLRFWRTSGGMDHLVRNGDGDDLLFIHGGAGALFCDYGHLPFEAGDYVLMPRGTMWRIECRTPASILMIEATNASYALPDRGALGPTAIFDPAVLDAPRIDDVFRQQQKPATQQWSIKIKRRHAISTATYDFNPLDTIGWHGDLMPIKLNVRHVRPVVSHRYHLPPSAHTTFTAERFTVGTFAPRPFETDPGALKVPFFHNNDDYDEVLFYHAGNFFSRDNIHPGMMTFHPAGFTHGPHPKALKNMLSQPTPTTEEYAIMIDARDPLDAGPDAAAAEWHGYVDSWKTPS